MNVLICHNYYREPGGEDRVFQQEADLLESKGHGVQRYSVHNDDIARMNRLSLAVGTVWRRAEAQRIRQLIRRQRPDVVHFHNTFPLISPAAYYAARLLLQRGFEVVNLPGGIETYRAFVQLS